jgi:hypothetical protein
MLTDLTKDGPVYRWKQMLGAKETAWAVLDRYDSVLRLRNRGRPRVLIYADSRARNITAPRKTHYAGSYVHSLQRSFHVTYRLTPHSHTTLVDFLNFTDQVDLASFDRVILHCGIVDFSPRPLSNLEKLRAAKAKLPRFDALFAANAGYHADPWDSTYRGEPTSSLYSPEYLRDELLPELAAIPNLTWISSNHFVAGWEGNYDRGRPANIEPVVQGFDAQMRAALPDIVDLSHWTPEQVRACTVDNIHLSRRGFRELAAMLQPRIA